MPKRRNFVESLKSPRWWNPLRVRDDLPEMIAKGADALTPAEEDLLKYSGFWTDPARSVRWSMGFARASPNADSSGQAQDAVRRCGLATPQSRAHAL
jgi:hypothetical protein